MPRDKVNSSSETVSEDISGLRETRNVILKHLINSSYEAQRSIDSDTERSKKFKNTCKWQNRQSSGILRKIFTQWEKTKWNFDKRGRNCRRFSKNWLFLVKPAISNPVNISFTSSKSSEARVKLPNFEIPKFNGNIIKIAIHDNENINEVEKFTYLKSF